MQQLGCEEAHGVVNSPFDGGVVEGGCAALQGEGWHADQIVRKNVGGFDGTRH